MSNVVCWLSDVLHVAEQLKHLCKLCAMSVVVFVYVYVEVATEYHWRVERRQPLEHRLNVTPMYNRKSVWPPKPEMLISLKL